MTDIFPMAFSRKPSKRIALDQVGDYTISTLDTSDCGPETAIWKGEDGEIIIVERYNTIPAAIEGHKAWVEYCNDFEPTQLYSIQYEDFISLYGTF